MAKKKDNIPSVLAFEKKLVFSDGYMYAVNWDSRDKEAVPLHLVEKSVRGTISNRLEDAATKDHAKLNAKIENANPQRVDACAMPVNYDTLKLQFSLKVLSGIDKPSACSNIEFAEKYGEVARAYAAKTGFSELAYRYAENIANARFLWRNRLGSAAIEVNVSCGERTWKFNAYDFSLKEFSDANTDIQALAAEIAAALSGEADYKLLTVTAYAKVGTGQEVYPSEEMVFNKAKNDKSKILYAVDGIAAMHSQKIGNAIRTIDTWYEGYECRPIAIEPYGAVTTLSHAYRQPSTGKDFYSLFDRYALGGKLETDDEHYVMAVLVRGGVFGESSKE